MKENILYTVATLIGMAMVMAWTHQGCVNQNTKHVSDLECRLNAYRTCHMATGQECLSAADLVCTSP